MIPTTAIPAYFHPAVAPGEWAALEALCADGTVRFVIANLADGPGSVDDDVWSTAIRRVSDAGACVLGYVDLGYLGSDGADGADGGSTARRTRSGDSTPAMWAAQALTDLDRWHAMLGARLGGVFFDCAPPAPDALRRSLLTALTDTARSLGSDVVVVMNPGGPAADALWDLADVVVSFEGPASASPCSDQSGRTSAADSWHIVHAVHDVDLADEIARRASSAGIAHLTLTDGTGANPYDSLPWIVRPADGDIANVANVADDGGPGMRPDMIDVDGSAPQLFWHRHEIRIEAPCRHDDDDRRILLGRVDSPDLGWATSTEPSIAARWMIENDRIHEYAGEGDNWAWLDRGPLPMSLGVDVVVWVVDPYRIGNADAYDVVSLMGNGRNARWSPVTRALRIRATSPAG